MSFLRLLAVAAAFLPLAAQASLPTSGPAGPSGSSPASPELREIGRATFAPSPKRDAHEIRFANGISFDTRQGEPALSQELRVESAPAPGERVALLVQVQAPIATGWAEELEAAGARVAAYLPSSTFLVRCTSEDRARIASLPFVQWTGDYHPAYRISGQAAMTLRSGRGEFQLLLFRDGSAAGVSDRVRFLGGEVQEISDNGQNLILRIELDRSAVAQIAAHPDLQWIEPREVFTVSNHLVQWVDQTNVPDDRKIWNNGLTGAGQVVMVGDSGIRTSHNMFRDNGVPITTWGDFPTHRKVIAYQKASVNQAILFGDAAGASYHGTHTSGTTAGNDNGLGTSTRDGLALDAKIYFIDGGGSDNSIITPGDLNDYFRPAYDGNAGGAARISTNSWGSSTGGAYTITCMTTDQFAHAHPDFLICFSNGNSGGTNTVGSPAAAKNILSVGGTRNGTSANLIYSSTSRGPTDDGRYKPTVCCPGQSVNSASGSGDASYATLSGTSMASPNMAGSATLVRQYLTEGWYPTGAPVPANSFVPSAALLRALMINSGVDDFSSYSLPDNNIGWGRILLDNVMYFPGDTRRTVVLDEADGVATGEVREYEVYVADASEDLQITLVWGDPASTPAAASNLVNDLDLVVTQGATTYLGNVFSGNQSVPGGSADGVNVEENVLRTSPAVGHWRIRVEGANVPFGPSPFALVISGGLGGDAGVLALDQSEYAPGGSLGIRVEDTDGGASVSVDIASTTEAGGETLVIPGTNGVYEASFPLTLVAPAADGALSVSDGDAITVSYSDANPSHTTVANATVNAASPEITGVSASSAGESALVAWTTNVLATSRIEYGLTTALGTLSDPDPSLVTAHSHLVEGLLPETTYFFDVISEDHAGNEVRDDFGGMHYRFTTGRRPDILLVNADANTTLNFEYYDQAMAATGWTYDTWGKAQADGAEVGDSNSGLRSYKAVWWQVGFEQYPQFLNGPRDSIKALHDGGARFAVASHDVAWAFSDLNSGFSNANRRAFLQDYLHATYNSDPATWSQATGFGGDPISAPYTGGVSYTPFRAGGAGDEVTPANGTGTATPIWQNNDVIPGNVGVRWESTNPLGTPGNGVWGGETTRVVSMFFEWLTLNAAVSNDPARNDILDRTLIWLVGGDHPDAAIVSPNGGESFVAGPVSISWTEATDTANGRNPAQTRLEYSDDGGMSWNLITDSPGSSPYSWDLSALPTGNRYRVRASVTDDGSPALAGQDASDADFTVAIPGNETLGPVVVAGTPAIAPFPAVVPAPVTLTATVTDGFTGNSAVTAAEWSAGASAAPAGTGVAMTGAFGAPTVAVTASVDTNLLPGGATSIWVRGQDAVGNWGNATELGIQVNGDATGVDVLGLPASFALAQNRPNPFGADTSIRFALPAAGEVSLDVFDVTGRRVRTLVRGPRPAGQHEVNWDGRNDEGQRVSSGVYFYRLNAGSEQAERKMIRLR